MQSLNKHDISFRNGLADDGNALLGIHRAAIRQLALNCYTQAVIESWVHGLTAEGYGQQMQEGEHFEIAERQGEIVGFCASWENEITGLFVHPKAARQKIGSELLTRAVACLRVRSTLPLRLEASLNSELFYQSQGWKTKRQLMKPTRGGLEMTVLEMEFMP